jgi:hypothetical protein
VTSPSDNAVAALLEANRQLLEQNRNGQSDNAVAALVETNRQLLEQNRRLTDAVLAICTPKAAQMIEQYELGRLQLQPVPPVPAVPPVSQPEPGVGA